MHTNSLRRQLLQRLLWPFVAIMLAGAVLAYLFAHRAAINTNDLGLLDDAFDLARQVSVRDGKLSLELPLAARQMLLENNDDQVVFAVWDEAGRPVAGDVRLLRLMRLPAGESYRFGDVALGKRNGRMVVVRSDVRGYPIRVAVFQTLRGQDRLLRDTLLGMLLPEALLALVSVMVILFGVKQGLRPVESLRDEIASRSPANLQPVQEATAPEELRPIIHGINELLANLAEAFAGHRRFIADAAHQLRTPLAALSGQIEVALQQPPVDSAALLRQLLATTRRTSNLANQLLSLARLEHTEEAVCEKVQVDLVQVVSDVAANYVVQAEHKGVALEFQLQPCLMQGNALLLGELVANLLDNALRYTPPGGDILVSLQCERGSWALAVQDSGPGVPASELGNLGMHFHRLDPSIPDGCGLGLAIVREIARIHGAEVSFSASGYGGLLVTIMFRQ